MSARPLPRYTLDEYLKLEDGLDSPHSEFHDGLLLPLEAATPNHSSLCAAIVGLLRLAFSPRCAVYDSSLNLYIPTANKILHPDATVLRGIPNYPKPDCIENPSLVVEVTSPSTKDYDNGTKREYYFSLPSVQHYLLVSQLYAAVGHYRRSGEGWIYVDRDENGLISLDEIEIRVKDIYAGIDVSGF